MMATGAALCLTGIGAIIGIPLIIAAIVSPFFSIGSYTLQGPCPYCENQVIALVSGQSRNMGQTCQHCRKRYLVKGNEFKKI